MYAASIVSTFRNEAYIAIFKGLNKCLYLKAEFFTNAPFFNLKMMPLVSQVWNNSRLIDVIVVIWPGLRNFDY